MIYLPGIKIASDFVWLPVTSHCAFELAQWIASRTGDQAGGHDSRWLQRIVTRSPGVLFWATHHAASGRSGRVSYSQVMEWFARGAASLLKNSSDRQPPMGRPYLSELGDAENKVRKYFGNLGERTSKKSNRPGSFESKMTARSAKLVSAISSLPVAEVKSWLRANLSKRFWRDLQKGFLSSAAHPAWLARAWAIDAALTDEAQPMTLGFLAETPPDRFADEASFHRMLNEQKMAGMKQLAYGASHEINNPLANIASRAQTLLMDEENPERRRKLEAINRQAFRAHEMIADMMLFAHPPDLEWSSIDPNELVGDVVAEMRPLADEQETKINWQVPALPVIQADRTQLAVATKALIQNALESLKSSGEVTIWLEREAAGNLIIGVADDGPGIDPQHQEHLFDPFFSGREAGRGLGFGLSKAWRIAELHAGSLLASPRSPQGALFELRIPYARAA